MDILYVHQNFPGQFRHIANFLDGSSEYRLRALAINNGGWQGQSRVHFYGPERGNIPNAHPWITELETKLIRAEAAYKAAKKLAAAGYVPDLIVAHPGWGESLFLRELWPNSKLIIYCEYFYGQSDVSFDPEFIDLEISDPCRLRVKNLNTIMHFDIADAGISPTKWQRSLFPSIFRNKIQVIHDGIDTLAVKPNPRASIKLGNRILTNNDQIITFVNRNLEPYRGYHIFMRSLPKILYDNPQAIVLIVGEDDVSYGNRPAQGTTWKSIFLDEVKPSLDLQRVFFLGRVSYQHFITLMQLSSAHVYLTYPFVLSWSLLEAMSCGCPIVASKTAPVEEIITDGENGLLIDFFSISELAASVTRFLKDPKLRRQIGEAARSTIVDKYDLRSICLPKTLEFYQRTVSL